MAAVAVAIRSSRGEPLASLCVAALESRLDPPRPSLRRFASGNKFTGVPSCDANLTKRARYWWVTLIAGAIATIAVILDAARTHAHADGAWLSIMSVQRIGAAYLMFLAGEQFQRR